MTLVYGWPPVGHVAAEWTQIAPVSRSRSLITGQSYVSAAQRVRRVATLEVSALSKDRNGAGYIEVLKRLLKGGTELVRLNSTPINWHRDAQTDVRTKPMSWIIPPEPVEWTDNGTDLEWWTGPGRTWGDSEPGGFVRVTGLPPNSIVVRPGEFLSMAGNVGMARRPAKSDANGVAMIRTVEQMTGSGPIVIGAQETGVFEADDMPRAVQPLGQNWTYSWSFREVFEDERGPFTEFADWWKMDQ